MQINYLEAGEGITELVQRVEFVGIEAKISTLLKKPYSLCLVERMPNPSIIALYFIEATMPRERNISRIKLDSGNGHFKEYQCFSPSAHRTPLVAVELGVNMGVEYITRSNSRYQIINDGIFEQTVY